MEINKWEYMIEPEFENLNELGKKGWEMVETHKIGHDTHGWILKRPCGKITMREVEKKTDRGYPSY